MSSTGNLIIDQDENNANKSQSDNLSIFCREVRNLLRSKPNCMIPFSKFVPAYHNHYGRQCCVYQFGYTKLIELLESIPHVVQIIGDGTNRYITLTHREQIKRFASDLIKVVKSQPGKKLKLSQFARAYEQVLGRIFRIEDYGTNNVNVLLAEIWEGTINIMPIKRELVDERLVPKPLFVNTSTNNNINNNNNNYNGINKQSSSPYSNIATTTTTTTISTNTTNNHHFSINNHLNAINQINNGSSNNNTTASSTSSILNQLVASVESVSKPYITDQYPDAWFEIPKRERSEKEIKRTKYFIWDVIELLSSMAPTYSVPFSKFIPSYHYYFNRQCKVSIFGFSKLIDLFESISPEVVEIIDQGPGEEKIIKLAEQHVPTNRTRNTIKTSSNSNNNSNSNSNNHRMLIKLSSTSPPGMISSSQSSSSSASSSSSSSSSFGDDVGDDIIRSAAIDCGPTEEELMELENELKAYEEFKALRSSRMAAVFQVTA